MAGARKSFSFSSDTQEECITGCFGNRNQRVHESHVSVHQPQAFVKDGAHENIDTSTCSGDTLASLNPCLLNTHAISLAALAPGPHRRRARDEAGDLGQPAAVEPSHLATKQMARMRWHEGSKRWHEGSAGRGWASLRVSGAAEPSHSRGGRNQRGGITVQDSKQVQQSGVERLFGVAAHRGGALSRVGGRS